MAPSECWKRLCSAAGKTHRADWSWGTRRSRCIHGEHGDRLETRRPHDHELDLLARSAEPEAAIEVGLARHLLAVHAHDHVAGAEAGHARRTDGRHAGDHEPAVRLPRVEAEPRPWRTAFHASLGDQLVLASQELLD